MITSKDNDQIKYIKSLFQKKYRDLEEAYIVEGVKMVMESLTYASPRLVVLCPEVLADYLQIKSKLNDSDINYIEVSESVFKSISDTITPQGILAVVNPREESDIIEEDIIFALDNIQDPGNLGTIIRTLDACGYKNLILSKDTVDAYNPKVVRSTMGGIFRLNLIKVNMELKDYLLGLKSYGYKIVSSSLNDSQSIYDFDFNNKLVIVIGNEANGVTDSILEISDYKIKIPMVGKTESLNASVATSIIAYEKVRRNI